MSKKADKLKVYYEIGFTLLLVVNAILLVYFILKLNQVENIARDTQVQAAALVESLEKK